MTDVPWTSGYIFPLDGLPVVERLKANWKELRDEFFRQRESGVPYPVDIYKGRWLVTSLRSNPVELGYLGNEHRRQVVEAVRGPGSADGLTDARIEAFFQEVCEEETARNRASHPLITSILDPLYPASCRMYNYSLMEPGVRLRAHAGADTSCIRVHLCLQDDPQCWLNVMGQSITWREGEVFGFDDANVHLAEHHGTRTRLVIIADFTKSYMTAEFETLNAG